MGHPMLPSTPHPVRHPRTPSTPHSGTPHAARTLAGHPRISITLYYAELSPSFRVAVLQMRRLLSSKANVIVAPGCQQRTEDRRAQVRCTSGSWLVLPRAVGMQAEC